MNETEINNCLKAYDKFANMAESWRRSVLNNNMMPWLKNLSTDELFNDKKINDAKEAYLGIYVI